MQWRSRFATASILMCACKDPGCVSPAEHLGRASRLCSELFRRFRWRECKRRRTAASGLPSRSLWSAKRKGENEGPPPFHYGVAAFALRWAPKRRLAASLGLEPTVAYLKTRHLQKLTHILTHSIWRN